MAKKIQMPNGDVLREMYSRKCMTVTEISKHFSVSQSVVYGWLKTCKVELRKRGTRPIDIAGQRFGCSRAVARMRDSDGTWKWLCRCDCGSERLVKSQTLRDGESKSCGKCKPGTTWSGVGEMSGSYFANLRASARTRGLEFKIQKEEIWNLYISQNGKCALTGVDIDFGSKANRRRRTASLDRRDSKIGYLINNVQWVYRDVNYMKMNLSEDVFIFWCKKVASYSDSKS